jgi:Mn-containing catalase
VILHYDRLDLEIPSGDPAVAVAVQEMMGRRFGEQSLVISHTLESFTFYGRNDLTDWSYQALIMSQAITHGRLAPGRD